MEAFNPVPPNWTQSAVHAHSFCCPTCRALSIEAERVWINRRSPVFTEEHRRKWQEFYHCHCGTAWWAWSSDRPPSEFVKPDGAEQLGEDSDFPNLPDFPGRTYALTTKNPVFGRFLGALRAPKNRPTA